MDCLLLVFWEAEAKSIQKKGCSIRQIEGPIPMSTDRDRNCPPPVSTPAVTPETPSPPTLRGPWTYPSPSTVSPSRRCQPILHQPGSPIPGTKRNPLYCLILAKYDGYKGNTNVGISSSFDVLHPQRPWLTSSRDITTASKSSALVPRAFSTEPKQGRTTEIWVISFDIVFVRRYLLIASFFCLISRRILKKVVIVSV